MPSFYDEVDSTGVVENHVKEVLRLEDEQAKIVMQSYKDARLGLLDRLSRAPSGSFTAHHLRGVLAQVNGAIIAINKSLQGDMVSSAYQAAMHGVRHLVKELNVFDKQFTGAVTPINLNAAVVAHDTSNLLVTKYKTNLDLYGRNLMGQITNGLFGATIGETSYDEVVGKISNFFSAEEWKLHRIVRTELHNIYNVGKVNGMQALVDDDTLPDLKKTLMHPLDARTGKDSAYAATLGLVAEVNESFEYTWAGKPRVFMAPPDRPNDRAILVPYREAWGSTRGAGFLPGTFPKA
jgi:hypothetical protein